MRRIWFLGVALLLGACAGTAEMFTQQDLGWTPHDSGHPLDAGVAADTAPVCTTAADCDDGNPCTTDSCGADGVCVHEDALGAPCDDGDACTVGEACLEGGQCGGGAPTELPGESCLECTCDPIEGVRCEPREVAAPCDDGDCCTRADRCVACDPADEGCNEHAVRCEGHADVCDDENECTTDACRCDPEGPVCDNADVVDGTPCELDPNACTEPDTCQAGACVQGAALDLDDGNACTRDRCVKGEITHELLNEGQCDDGDPCTEDDRCSLGVCVGGPRIECDKPACASSASCVAGEGCVAVWKPEGALCDDGDGCTAGDHCDADHACVSGAPVDVDDGNPCTVDACDAATGEVTHVPRVGACDDGDPCTHEDACQEDGSCAGLAMDCSAVDDPCVQRVCNPETGLCDLPMPDGTGCGEQNPCDGGAACRRGECVAGEPVDCSGVSDPCLQTVCNPATGRCDLPTPDGRACDDGDPCTVTDRCAAGLCRGEGSPCAGECLTGECLSGAEGVECIVAPDGTGCDDGNPLTDDDTCRDGVCGGSCGGPDQPCDPLDDQCEALCGDGDPCTGVLACVEGTCQVLVDTVVTCPTAPSACQRYVCQPATSECVLVAAGEGTGCDDGDPCTESDTCSGGVCGGQPVLCEDDGNTCTDELCDAAQGGCIHRPRSVGQCDDGDACTTDDRCLVGNCVGSPVDCGDGNDCTDDVCLRGACVSSPVDGRACDDGDRCTVGDACDASGVCQPGNDTPDEPEDCSNGVDDDCDGLTDTDDDECAGLLECDFQENCQALPGTLCATWPMEHRAYCSQPCAHSDDCDPGLSCWAVPGSAMVGFCATTAPLGAGGPGAPCVNGGDCRSGWCDNTDHVCLDLCTGEGLGEEYCATPGYTCAGAGDAVAGFQTACFPDIGLATGAACTVDAVTYDSSLCSSGHCDLAYPLADGQQCAPLCGSVRDCPYDDQVCDIIFYSSDRVLTSIPFSDTSNKTHDVLLGCYYSGAVGSRTNGMSCTLNTDCRTNKCLPVVLGDPTDWRCTGYCTKDADCGNQMVCGLAELNLVSGWLQDPSFQHQSMQQNESTMVRLCMYPE